MMVLCIPDVSEVISFYDQKKKEIETTQITIVNRKTQNTIDRSIDDLIVEELESFEIERWLKSFLSSLSTSSTSSSSLSSLSNIRNYYNISNYESILSVRIINR
ncbi:hypothetical protein LOAG_11709 [Loa loa]|uniref:Uncharacterized protein n=1 Tax=Loa loa TaxID=7209 RepID=A0A1S0TMI6_LOALO|nr:hypothetical protein LOAG_11709 [Loa loa]EFO16795.1 hypothetical protein LOAG_11709 [Loa loa]